MLHAPRNTQAHCTAAFGLSAPHCWTSLDHVYGLIPWQQRSPVPLTCARLGWLCELRAHSEWDPETDPHLAFNYSINSFVEGKAKNKEALQASAGCALRV